MTAEEAFKQAFHYGWSQELEDIVVDSGYPEWAYMFAQNIEGANIDRLQQVVIDAGDPNATYDFARRIKGANIDRLQQVMIDYGDPKWAYWFAIDVKGANISDLVDFVLVKNPILIRVLFNERPDLKRKYKMGEIRSIVRAALK